MDPMLHEQAIRTSVGTGAVARPPASVFEPMAGVLSKSRRAGRLLGVVVYRAGKEGRGASEAVLRSDALIALVRQVIRDIGAEKAVEFKVRPQLWFWWLPLAKGAWRAPILVVGGDIFSQGTVPPQEALKQSLLERLSAGT